MQRGGKDARMAPSSTRRSLSNRGPSLLRLALAWTVTFSLTESSELIRLSGEVGGNVTFRCPFNNQRTIQFFYLQRDNVFVNGYHAFKTIFSGKWPNTRLDDKSTHVDMYGLNISHTGRYKCFILYTDNENIEESEIQLNVTASYSKPNVTQSCDDARCLVTCAFYGGYPGNMVEWKLHGSRNIDNQLWNVENNTQVHSPSTMLVNSSSIVYFSCSHGAIRNLSCSVGNVTSEWFPVCDRKPEVKPNPHSLIIIAPVVCGLILLGAVVWFFYRRKKRQTARIKDGNKDELKDLQE
ncbi:uncharacterized protein LOC133952315 isoform X2 [Platichthys flesus]|uniref:uncharacterized protein LOC133952315 isoform X2 n=1 Tax=Platichthys flesus TaxID=8260 RepID=UPI002DBE0CE6|nr:uncharacterized protein LOC133952315 isoform X2 [Platichthys flesus]